jgi:hypothetical protein
VRYAEKCFEVSRIIARCWRERFSHISIVRAAFVRPLFIEAAFAHDLHDRSDLRVEQRMLPRYQVHDGVSLEDFTDPRRAGMGECFIPDDSDRGLLSAD